MMFSDGFDDDLEAEELNVSNNNEPECAPAIIRSNSLELLAANDEKDFGDSTCSSG